MGNGGHGTGDGQWGIGDKEWGIKGMEQEMRDRGWGMGIEDMG